MFTDRFIKVPVDLYNIKEAEMVGFNSQTNVGSSFCKINPFEISHYRPTVDDKQELSHTLIYPKNGASFETTLSVKQFEELLNNSQQ